jgi:hypothetical protein
VPLFNQAAGNNSLLRSSSRDRAERLARLAPWVVAGALRIVLCEESGDKSCIPELNSQIRSGPTIVPVPHEASTGTMARSKTARRLTG